MIFAGAVGFETGRVGEILGVTGTALTIYSTAPISGAYSGRCLAANSFGFIETGQTGGSAGTVDFFQFRIRVVTAPSADCGIFRVYDTGSATNGWDIRLTTSRTLQVWNHAATPAQVGSASPALEVGQTYLVQMSGNWDNNTMTARLDGTNFVTDGACNYDCDRVRCGMGIGSVNLATGEWIVDDIIGVRNSGSGPTSWIDGRVVHLYPNGAGDADTSVAVTGGGGVAHTALSETPPDDDTSYIAATGTAITNLICDTDVQSSSSRAIPSGSTIHCVMPCVRVKTGGTQAHSYFVGVKGQSGGTVSASANVALNAAAAWFDHDDTLITRTPKLVTYTNPQDSQAWETSDLDAAQLRIGSVDNNPGPPRFTQGYLLVVYTAAPLVVTPAAASSTSSTPNPTVAANETVAPSAASATPSTPNPTVDTGGGATVTPAAAASTASTPGPTVVANETVVPAAAASTPSTPAPTVVLGSLSITPAVASSTASTPAPTVVANANVIPAAASATPSTPAPTIVANATVTPGAASGTASTPAPTVVANALVTPAAASATALTTGASVQGGGGTVVTPDPASATASTTAPTVVLGSLVVLPTPASATPSTPAPTVVLGAILVIPSAASSTASTPNPTVDISGGDTIVTPAPASATTLTITPAVVANVVLTPQGATATVSTILLAVVGGLLYVREDVALLALDLKDAMSSLAAGVPDDAPALVAVARTLPVALGSEVTPDPSELSSLAKPGMATLAVPPE